MARLMIPVFKNMDEVRVALGTFAASNFNSLALSSRSGIPVLRVVSTGQSSDTTRVIQLVFRRAGTTPQLITWKEF
jgi:hypothetical protein